MEIECRKLMIEWNKEPKNLGMIVIKLERIKVCLQHYPSSLDTYLEVNVNDSRSVKLLHFNCLLPHTRSAAKLTFWNPV